MTAHAVPVHYVLVFAIPWGGIAVVFATLIWVVAALAVRGASRQALSNPIKYDKPIVVGGSK